MIFYDHRLIDHWLFVFLFAHSILGIDKKEGVIPAPFSERIGYDLKLHRCLSHVAVAILEGFDQFVIVRLQDAAIVCDCMEKARQCQLILFQDFDLFGIGLHFIPIHRAFRFLPSCYPMRPVRSPMNRDAISEVQE